MLTAAKNMILQQTLQSRESSTQSVACLSCLLVVALMLQGCASLGPGNLQAGRADYNQAIQRSNDEQMLLNLVRLKYRDVPMFLEVGSVSAQMNYTVGIGGSGSFVPSSKPSGAMNMTLGYAEKPTVSYAPLQGEKFIQQLLTPISLDRLALLYHSGWSVERLFRLCVQRLNNVRNAPRASGPTPDTAPVFESFQVISNLLRQLQINDGIDLYFNSYQGTTLPVLAKKSGDTQNSHSWQKLLKLLEMQGSPNRLFITDQLQVVDPNFLRVETRSFMGVLFLLSQSVVVPGEDEGLVTMTKNAEGQPFDWNLLTGGLMRIQNSAQNPGSKAATAVHYRNRWFFIADNDLSTKSTFSLLHQLFSLQAGKTSQPAPLLTLPLGG